MAGAIDQVARDAARQAQSDIDSHEEICAVRYAHLNEAIGGLKSELRWGGGVALTIILGMLAWLATNYIDEIKANSDLRREMISQRVEQP